MRPGTEVVGEVQAEIAGAHLRLRLAERFLREGFFEAVGYLYEENRADFDVLPSTLAATAKGYATVAPVYAAWDRFDYKGAIENLNYVEGNAGQFATNPEIENWLDTLSAGVGGQEQ